ncbi:MULTISPECIES: saccharopine dehydrogenase family protein [Dyella]|uniref:Saccharopine dehydrogenase n=2 Tax=Dyella TaxID=231454 RepID=A0A4R0YIN0_9GAMM|nr:MULTISPECIES: saccharopine dehydrogenase NADP-binding domain-containing protein [Dyella]TBR36608.1 saccharopine dehydrogenase [Dyella terrae]TCI08300.1 saccharopine dehydrogenase [Dyella soli]
MRVVVLGATGVFGSRAVRRLAHDPRFKLVLAGRRLPALEALRDELGDPLIDVAKLDIGTPAFADALAALHPQLVIHAAGPFQGQDYDVADACIACGSHYIDLADARQFVNGITALDRRARDAGCLIVSGASSVPALSAAVVDTFLPRFAELQTIEHAINPGNRTPRGDATVAAILGYCGKPIRAWRDGRWQQVHGWMDSRWQAFRFGRRWTGACDVPDLDLFPERYRGVRTVVFRAGLELTFLQGATWLMAWLVRFGLIDNLANHAARLRRMSEWFLSFGSDVGGMVVEMRGTGTDGAPLTLRWWLDADAGDGPQVPITPLVVLARRMADGQVAETGAMPCMGLMSLDDIVSDFKGFALKSGVEDLTVSR